MSKDGTGNPPLNLKNYAGVPPFRRTTEQAGFPPATPKSTIHKEDRHSVFRRVSDIAKGLSAYAASKNPFSFTNKRDAAFDEYQKWKTEHPSATLSERKAKFNEYNQKVQKLRRKGGKNKSRKSRKSRKSGKSRKNRKTRSRK